MNNIINLIEKILSISKCAYCDKYKRDRNLIWILGLMPVCDKCNLLHSIKKRVDYGL